MLLTDAMSRCPAAGSEEIKLDMRVNYIAFNKTWIAKLKKATWEDPILSTVYQLKLDMRVNYIAFNKTWIAKLKKATWEDPILSTVYQLTQQG